MKDSGFPRYPLDTKAAFRDIQQYKKVIAGISKALLDQTHVARSPAYLFQKLKVDMSAKWEEEEIYLDYLNAEVVLRAPKKNREAISRVRDRRLYYLGAMLKQVEAMKTIGFTHIFLALAPEGQRQVEMIGAECAKQTNSDR